MQLAGSKFYFRDNSLIYNLQIRRLYRAPLDNHLNRNKVHEINLLSKVSLEAVCLGHIMVHDFALMLNQYYFRIKEGKEFIGYYCLGKYFL